MEKYKMDAGDRKYITMVVLFVTKPKTKQALTLNQVEISVEKTMNLIRFRKLTNTKL